MLREYSRGCREIWFCWKWTEFGMVIAEGAAGFEERLGSCKYCKLGTGTLPAFETWYFPFVSFLTSLCRGFLATLVLQTKVQGYLCDFSMLLIYCHVRNWACVHNGGSCILDLNMFTNSSQGNFDKVDLICTRHWCHRWKFQTYLFSTCFFYRTHIKSKYVKDLSNFSYVNSLAKIRNQIFHS